MANKIAKTKIKVKIEYMISHVDEPPNEPPREVTMLNQEEMEFATNDVYNLCVMLGLTD